MLSKVTNIFRSNGTRINFLKYQSTQAQPKVKGQEATEHLEKVTPVKEANKIPEWCYQPRVVIIGAGMAGLTAANWLCKSGLTSVKIIEAHSKPGGRIKTCKFGDVRVELGCPHISGASIANPVYTLAARAGLIKDPLKREDRSKGLYFTSDGRALAPSMVQKAQSLYNSLIARAKEVRHCGSEPRHKSLSGFLDEEFLKELEERPEVERFDLARLVYGLLNELKATTGADLADTSLVGFGSRGETPGGEATVEKGMDSLLEPLLENLPADWLSLSTRVRQVRWGAAGEGGPRAVVECSDGSAHEADFVLVTVSLGVLKASLDTLFCPALPSVKADPLRALGFGTLGRVLLRWANPFWAGPRLGLHLSWSPDEISEAGGGWPAGICSLREVGPGLLVVEVGGAEARRLEHATDEEMVETLACLVRRFLDDPYLPWPCEAARSVWALDPLFGGSSTYLAVGSTTADIEAAAMPLPHHCADYLPPILFFAGEHTHTTHYGTLQGARQSGFREASRILSYAQEFNFLAQAKKTYSM